MEEPSGTRRARRIIKFDDSCTREFYQGEVLGDSQTPHGTGLLVFKDGRKYIGQFEDYYPHGQGTMYSKDGSVLDKGLFESYNGFYFTKESNPKCNTVKIFFEDGKMAEKLGTVKGLSETTIFDADGFRMASGPAALAKCARRGWGLCMESHKKVWFNRGKCFEGDFKLSQGNDDVINVKLINGTTTSS